MKHVGSITAATVAPAPAETLLEWTQKGAIANSFANAISTLAETKVTLQG